MLFNKANIKVTVPFNNNYLLFLNVLHADENFCSHNLICTADAAGVQLHD